MMGGKLRGENNASVVFSGVSIDSRTLKPGEMFVAVRGDRTDGHKYVSQALERGAAGIVTEESWPQFDTVPAGIPAIEVDNSHEAMMTLAEKHRQSLPARFVGITGSNGKTTTKELTYCLLGAVDKNVYRSPGNYNNLFGMPLALFAMPRETGVAVMEMGISVPGEMACLTRMVKPDVIVITNVGPSHLQFLSSVEGVARAKLELVVNSPENVPVIVNGDNEVLLQEASKIRSDITTFGLDAPATFRADKIESGTDGVTVVEIEGHTFRLPLFGRYQVYNLLAGYAAFRALGYTCDGIDTEKIAFATAPWRGEKVTREGITFIVDCYNANPDSVRAGLESFAGQQVAGRKVVVLGDMLELGKNEREYHHQIGHLAGELAPDHLILTGPLSTETMAGAIAAGFDRTRLTHFERAADTAAFAREFLTAGDLVFVKGSRGIGLEAVVNVFEAEGKAN